MGQWEIFLSPYKQAVDELKVKLKGMRSQFGIVNANSPIEFVTGRVKPLASIYDKTLEKGLAFEPSKQLGDELGDIAGLRIMCQFVDDIATVTELIRQRKDMRVVEERDYITHNKPSGYRSYHMIVEYPVETIQGKKVVLAEIQIRTLAMNFWASIEHSLNYKYKGMFPEEIKNRLQSAAEAAFRLDEEMSLIRSEIQEAQAYFSEYKEASNPNLLTEKERDAQ
ncbi:MAG TPA: GTP pyrophosphokinase family protein [Lysinibacillus sp.]|jgi:putative GTP pyrophosphokinase|uniref:GTP diphosphokinase n=1 Tax=Lysinibacillus fusiformis TaxID=28031 RepID=A0A2I0V5K3_9BACI|nr:MULTISPECIES: GTP pyrophosphokinase family protein [Lysinibacillus]HBT71005.1 GTP pyrophosphokinase family protein [Lysinibacillus sp.]KUF31857.1 GTP pyrophosphokinase [Lysinibacillus sp. F5]MEE3807462.1 GTP pyrophosphokinase family protein [Lysinibacillus fusiformis]PKU53558.1 GTP pyrophosphokinase [Lysinibacillus fusiformis]WCH48480.1 GTP pyrophosphokinase family protein [Lysinibacillus sp. OF-1]